MNINQITRNAENQVAVALRNKVDRFVKAKKNRQELVIEIIRLTEDLKRIVFRRPFDPELEKKPIAPLPTRDERSPLASLMVDICHPGHKLSEEELNELNTKIKGQS